MRPPLYRLLAAALLALAPAPRALAQSAPVDVRILAAAGGDGFTVLKDGTAPRFGVYDVDALYGYFQANSPVAPAAADRIARLN